MQPGNQQQPRDPRPTEPGRPAAQRQQLVVLAEADERLGRIAEVGDDLGLAADHAIAALASDVEEDRFLGALHVDVEAVHHRAALLVA